MPKKKKRIHSITEQLNKEKQNKIVKKQFNKSLQNICKEHEQLYQEVTKFIEMWKISYETTSLFLDYSKEGVAIDIPKVKEIKLICEEEINTVLQISQSIKDTNPATDLMEIASVMTSLLSIMADSQQKLFNIHYQISEMLTTILPEIETTHTADASILKALFAHDKKEEKIENTQEVQHEETSKE